ncbi:Radial spoke protein 3 [Aureococcus anophagefferens]|nr:Radial spoke protein 3 [Aureococcus anophagefferens]
MSDPRVVRGSTYSLYRSLPGDGAPMEDTVPPTPGGAPARKARRKKKKADGRSIFDAKPSSNSKQALDLTPYLVEKAYASSAVEEAAQTDGFLEQPPPAPFAPPKTGTLEQAMLEVEQEEELAAIADDMSDKLARQAAEKARVEAMEQAEVDREKAKLGDFESARAALVEEQTLARKVASSRLVDQLLPEIFEGAYRHFEDRGSWVEPVLHEIKATTLPWLYARVDEELEGADLGAKLVDDLLQYCVDQAKMREPEPEPEPEPADEPEAEAAPDGDAAGGRRRGARGPAAPSRATTRRRTQARA